MAGRAAQCRGGTLQRRLCACLLPARRQPSRHLCVTCVLPSMTALPFPPQRKDSVAAAVILTTFFDDPGAAVLVKPWRPAGASGRYRHARPPWLGSSLLHL